MLTCLQESDVFMIDPRVASGLRDLSPAQMIPRERMLAAFRQTFAAFGFMPIETPHIERMEVLTGKGAGSEEVLRQIFEVTNKGGTPGELALRFDLTVPLARLVAKHIDEVQIYELNKNLQQAIAANNQAEAQRVAETISKKGELMGPRAAKKTMLARQVLQELNVGGRVSKKTQLAVDDAARLAEEMPLPS